MSCQLDTGIRQDGSWENWEERFNRARQCDFPDIGSVSSPAVKWLLAHHAAQAACTEDMLFIPFLTCCSHMMGVNTCVKVNDYWSEPSILWTVSCARRGTGKTAILKQFVRPLLDLQCEHERQWHLSRPSSSQTSGTSAPSKLLCGPTSLTELYNILGKNGGQMLTLEENLKNLHRHLLCGENGEILSGEELHNLYDAMPKFSSKDGEVSIMTTTCYNHFGMADPHYIQKLFLNKRLCLYDRYLIACLNDLRRPLSITTPPPASKIPTIKSIFQTMHVFHRHTREYIFNAEAVSELDRFKSNDIQTLTTQLGQDEVTRLALEKSAGQVVRLAGAIKAMTNACVFAAQVTNLQFIKWDLVIDRDTVLKAIRIQKYFLEQKIVLLHGVSSLSESPAPSVPATSYHFAQSTSQSPMAESPVTSVLENKTQSLNEHRETHVPDFMSMSLPQFVANYSNKIRRLLEYADDGNGIPASVAAQYSIPPIVRVPGSSNKKPTWAAELFFKKVAELGIGRLCYVKHHAKYYLRFRRKRREELNESDYTLLETLRVNCELFLRVGNESLGASEVVMSPYESSPQISLQSQTLQPEPELTNETVPLTFIKKELTFEEDNTHNT